MTKMSIFQLLIDGRPSLKKDAKKNLKSAKKDSQAVGTHQVVNAAETENNVDAGDPLQMYHLLTVPYVVPKMLVQLLFV